jgi:hypothetical protein
LNGCREAEITQVALVVEHKLKILVAEVTAASGA